MTALPAVEEATLPVGLQRGLRAIRERVLPEVRVVAADGNFSVIAVGTMTKAAARAGEPSFADAELPAVYTANSVELFARVATNFPHAQPYGVITVPFLTRADERGIEWQHLNNPNAHAVASALGGADVGFWSWGWQNMPQREPEDLVSIVEWARKCIREGAR